MIVRELVTKLGFSIDNKNLDKFEKSVQNTKQSLKNFSNSLAPLMQGLNVISTAVTAAQAALLGITISTANNIRANAEMAQSIGTTSQNLQELEAIAQKSGAKVGELSDSLVKFGKGVGESRFATTEMSREFIRLGINTRNSNGTFKDTTDLYTEAARKIKDLKEPTRQLAATQKIFGSNSQLLVNSLGLSKKALEEERLEVRKLITVFDTDAINASNKFIKSWNTLKLALRSIKDTIAIAVMPAITATIQSFNSWYISNKNIIDQRLNRFVLLLADAFKVLSNITSAAFATISQISDFFGGFENVIIAVATAIAISLVPTLATLISSFYKLTVAMLSNPFTAVVTAIVLIVNSLYHWINGNESIIGYLLGDWVTFKDQFIDIVNSIYNAFADKFGKIYDLAASVGSKIKNTFSFGTSSNAKEVDRKQSSNAKEVDSKQLSSDLQKYKISEVTRPITEYKTHQILNTIDQETSKVDQERSNMDYKKYNQSSKEEASITQSDKNTVNSNNGSSPKFPENAGTVKFIPLATPTSNPSNTNNSRNITSNIKQNITNNMIINVPEGTNAEQARSIQEQVSKEFDSRFYQEFQAIEDSYVGG